MDRSWRSIFTLVFFVLTSKLSSRLWHCFQYTGFLRYIGRLSYNIAHSSTTPSSINNKGNNECLSIAEASTEYIFADDSLVSHTPNLPDYAHRSYPASPRDGLPARR